MKVTPEQIKLIIADYIKHGDDNYEAYDECPITLSEMMHYHYFAYNTVTNTPDSSEFRFMERVKFLWLIQYGEKEGIGLLLDDFEPTIPFGLAVLNPKEDGRFDVFYTNGHCMDKMVNYLRNLASPVSADTTLLMNNNEVLFDTDMHYKDAVPHLIHPIFNSK